MGVGARHECEEGRNGSRLFPFLFVVIHVFFTSDGSERDIISSISFRRFGTSEMKKFSKTYFLRTICILCIIGSPLSRCGF